LIIKPGTKPVQGYNRTLAFDLCQAKDKFKDRHIKIHGCNADKAKGIKGALLKEAL
jgi:hypothetical protein